MKILGKTVKIFGGGMKKVEFILPYVQGKTCLDIGVVAHRIEAYDADNWLHKNLVRVSKKCVGIDIMPKEIEYLHSKGFEVYVKDAQNFQFDEKFDVVVAGDVIEHLDDLKGFINSSVAALQPDGKFVITTANPWFFVRFGEAFLRGRIYENPEHTCWLSIGTLTELLRRYDLKVEFAGYGSSEKFLGRLFFLPSVLRHTGIWLVAVKA